MQPYEIKISGIKCDAEGCDYSSPDVLASDYQDYLEKPCPKCGAPLLTEQDLLAVQMLMATVEWGNSMVGEVPDDHPMVDIPLKMDGTGTVGLKDDLEA